MKRILPVAIAFAFAAFVTACGEDANRPAGSGATGGTATTPSTPGGTTDQQKRGTQSPSSPSGSGSTSGSGAKP